MGMYLHLGQNVMVPFDVIVGIFYLDNTTWSHRTRRFLERAETRGQVITVGDDLPRSFVLCQTKGGDSQVYISQVNTATLIRRVEQNRSE